MVGGEAGIGGMSPNEPSSGLSGSGVGILSVTGVNSDNGLVVVAAIWTPEIRDLEREEESLLESTVARTGDASNIESSGALPFDDVFPSHDGPSLNVPCVCKSSARLSTLLGDASSSNISTTWLIIVARLVFNSNCVGASVSIGGDGVSGWLTLTTESLWIADLESSNLSISKTPLFRSR